MSTEAETVESQEDDKGRNLVRLRKIVNEKDKELKQLRTEQRQNDLESILSSNGFPSTAAKHYPEDAEVTEEAVLEFLGDLGGAPSRPTAEDRERYSAYTAYVSGAWSYRPDDGVETLQAKLHRGVEKIMNRHTMPTQEERDEHEQLCKEVNLLNKRMEKEVRMGRMQPHQGGFGGLVNPPRYADAARQAREKG